MRACMRARLSAARTVLYRYAEAAEYAASLGWAYVECSSKTGENVERAVYTQVALGMHLPVRVARWCV